MFAKTSIFTNPSRASLYDVTPQPPTSETQQSTTYALTKNAVRAFQYAIFTSVIAVTKADLLDPNTSSMFRQVNGVLCKQEWERFYSFFCMVFGERELRAQIYEDTVTFSTCARPREGIFLCVVYYVAIAWSDCNTDQHRTASGISGLFSGNRSGPSSPVKVSGGVVPVRGALNFDDHGQYLHFKLTAISNIHLSPYLQWEERSI